MKSHHSSSTMEKDIQLEAITSNPSDSFCDTSKILSNDDLDEIGAAMAVGEAVEMYGDVATAEKTGYVTRG